MRLELCWWRVSGFGECGLGFLMGEVEFVMKMFL